MMIKFMIRKVSLKNPSILFSSFSPEIETRLHAERKDQFVIRRSLITIRTGKHIMDLSIHNALSPVRNSERATCEIHTPFSQH